MNWLQVLADELRAGGIPAATCRRILFELADHISYEPGCEERLGDPRALAATFADELATTKSRRSALHGFAALTATAVALAISQLTLGQVGYPGFDHGISQMLFWPALIGIFIAPQVALVAGSLAAVRALRRRRVIALPANEVALITRRTRVAVGAGFSTVAGLELYVIDFCERLPAWWLALSGGLALVAGAGLVTASRSVAGAVRLGSSVAGSAGDISEDLPLLRRRWLRAQPWRLGLLASLFAALLMTAVETQAEHSLVEGIQRGVVEGLIAAVGFAILGRGIGVASARRARQFFHGGQARKTLSLRVGSPQRRASDADRADAEHLVRDSFALGQISLEELDARVTAIHAAATLGELRNAVTDLV